MDRELHLDIKPIDTSRAELRLYLDNPNEYRSRQLSLEALRELVRLGGEYYESAPPAIPSSSGTGQILRDLTIRLASQNTSPLDLVEIGQWLYRWLDGDERFLDKALAQYRGASLLSLLINIDSQVIDLPWELLHDGDHFLVNRKAPAVVPLRWRPAALEPAEPANRPLELLFMASSPVNTFPVLDFEAEEAQILNATKRQPLTLTVEESGNLDELRNLIASRGADSFDVFHLTGHASRNESGPHFLMESETGQVVATTPQELERALIHMPRLIFLSGCRTAEGGDPDSVPSMAETLLDLGVPAVLGWARPVRDHEASLAAAVLYEALAIGLPPAEALSRTYQALIERASKENKPSDWHLLRLYAAGRRLPHGLVTPLKQKGRLHPARRSTGEAFLDRARQIPVAAPQDFVGRRRPLQRCLQALRDDVDSLGVLLTGMRGVGKSSLAHRLKERLPGHRAFVWQGRMDEPRLVNQMADELERSLRDLLRDPDELLKLKLKKAFEQLKEPLLFIFDEFEANAERRQGDLVLREGLPLLGSEAAAVIEALAWAIETSQSSSRILVTSRFNFSFGLFRRFHHEPLAALSGAELGKKVERLLEGRAGTERQREMAATAASISDGNPRLLEWLFRILEDGHLDAQVLQERLAAKQGEFREHVLAREVLAAQSPELRQVLSVSLIFEVPVPKEAIAAVVGLMESLGSELDRAVELGLLEATGDPVQPCYRVPRILGSLLPAPEAPEDLSARAARALAGIWPPALASSTDEQRLEIHRLALTGREGPLALAALEALSDRWMEHSRFQELAAICSATARLVQSHKVLSFLGSAEFELGETELALGHLRQALALCPPDKQDEKRQILGLLAFRLGDQGALREALEFCQQALALLEEGESRERAEALHQMGYLLRDLGEVDRAMESFQEAVRLFRALGDAKGLAATTADMAHAILFPTGRTGEALGRLHEVLQVFEDNGDLLAQAAVLHNMADIFLQVGQAERALDLCERSLLLSRKTGSVRGQAATLRVKANVLAARGAAEQAEACYEESLALAERMHNTSNQAITLYDFARFLLARKDLARARGFLETSLALDQKSGRVSGQIAALFSLAEIELLQERPNASMQLYRQALEIATRSGDALHEAAILDAMAKLQEEHEETSSSLELHERSLAIKRRMVDRRGELESVFQIASLNARLGHDAEALSLFGQAFEIAAGLDNAELQVACVQSMAVLQEKAGRLDDAAPLYQQALALRERLRDERGQSMTLFHLARLAVGRHEIEQAITFYRRALAIDERLGDREGQAVLHQCLGDLLVAVKRGPEAVPAYRAALSLHERAGNLPGQGLILLRLAILMEFLEGEPAREAVALYERCLQVAGNLDDSDLKARVLRHLITIHHQHGRLEEASPYVEQLRGLVAQGAAAPVETVRLVLGKQLVPLADPEQGGRMLEAIKHAREDLARGRKLSLPPVRVHDSDQLAEQEYEMVFDQESVRHRATPEDPSAVETIVLNLRDQFVARCDRFLAGSSVS